MWNPRTVRYFSGALVILFAQALVGATLTAAAVDPMLTKDDRSVATVELTDGSIIVGRVIDIVEDNLHLDTAFSDDLTIDLALVKNFRWFQKTSLLLDDERVVDLDMLQVSNGQLIVGKERIDVEIIDTMNPAEWEIGKGYHWTGNTSVAAALSRGNTQTDELDVALNTVLTSVHDRYTINTRLEQDHTYTPVVTANGETSRDKVATADNWKILGKYDYFLDNPRNYLGVNASVEADALAGIDQRIYAGPYAGRRLLEKPQLSLDGELGLALVNTDYDASVNQADTDYAGLNWNITGTSSVLGADAKLYLRHVGILDLQQTDQLILKTTLGLTFPLLLGLEGAAEFTYDYDGTAAADRDEVDQAYRFRIGYAW